MVVRLPDPGWVFIHPLIIVRKGGAATVPDAEGRWSTVADEEVSEFGYISIVGRQEQELAEQLGVTIDAVAAFGRDVVVDESDEIRVVGVDPYLDGRYRITAVRPTPVHLRVLLQRTQLADGTPVDA